MEKHPLATKPVDDIYIAGFKTIEDWRAFRAKLVPGDTPALWQTAFEEYFHERLSLRYLEPIRVLQENGTFRGEGFSIVAIQCSLVEFLESTVRGISYLYQRRGVPPLGQYEYSNSGDLFTQFLTKREPFAKDFDDASARDFYESVRCGLLHEARTKNGWTIWAKGPAGATIDSQTKTVHRDNFQKALLEFISWYKTALCSDPVIQAAFIRKFDSLCN